MPMCSSLCKRRFTIAVGVLIVILSVMPSSGLPSYGIRFADKIVHIVMYLAFTVAFLVDGFCRIGCVYLSSRSLWQAVTIAIVLGVAMEAVQWALPYRTASIYDIVANTIGTALGIFAIFTIHLISNKHK